MLLATSLVLFYLLFPLDLILDALNSTFFQALHILFCRVPVENLTNFLQGAIL